MNFSNKRRLLCAPIFAFYLLLYYVFVWPLHLSSDALVLLSNIADRLAHRVDYFLGKAFMVGDLIAWVEGGEPKIDDESINK